MIKLPLPQKSGGTPLLDALSARHATRNFSDKEIPLQVLSNLLWATWGVNRADGGRVAPTALNRQQVALYVIKADGAFLCDAQNNTLKQVLDGDYRNRFGGAPLNFLYAAPTGEYDPLHIGALFQNAALYAASINLGSVVRAQYSNALASELPLEKDYKTYISQSFGWPR